MRMIRIQS